MKKILLLIIIVTIFSISNSVIFAQSVTPKSSDTTPTPKSTASKPSPSPTQDAELEKIKDLVASKVAQLKLVDKRGIVGTVKTVSNTQITLSDNDVDTGVDVDELTKFNSDKSSFGISDIKKGDVLSVVGLYNKDSEKLLARFVEIASYIPVNIEGVVISKDTKEYTFNIVTASGKHMLINVDTSTKTSSYADGTTTKSGFSKMDLGQRVIIVGFLDKNNSNQLNAERVIHFPSMELSNDLKKQAAAQVTETPAPTK